ncbi:MAG: Harpin HrpZ [Pseudomonas fluorescens]|nr:MAG: Harpin HrpZ [Pseudomonas fluorescens]
MADLIKDKLGNNFGASASAGMGGGKDLMSQVMQGLSKAALNDALTPEGDGSTFSDADKPLLRKVADFMDQNKATFGTPDSGSWRKELNEDNYLNKDETSKFRAALEQISQQMDGSDSVSGSAAPQSTAGGLGSLQNDPLNDTSDDDSSDDNGPITQGGLGTPQAGPDDSGSDDSADSADASGANSPQQLLQQLEQLLGANKDQGDSFKQGLQLGLGIASALQGAQMGGHHHHHQEQDPQMQDQNLQASAAQAAQSILAAMSAGVS